MSKEGDKHKHSKEMRLQDCTWRLYLIKNKVKLRGRIGNLPSEGNQLEGRGDRSIDSSHQSILNCGQVKNVDFKYLLFHSWIWSIPR